MDAWLDEVVAQGGSSGESAASWDPAGDQAAGFDGQLLDEYSRTVSSVVLRAAPSVAAVHVRRPAGRRGGEGWGSGSGFLFTPDGYISDKSLPGYTTYYAAALTALMTASPLVVVTVHNTECFAGRPKLIGINLKR